MVIVAVAKLVVLGLNQVETGVGAGRVGVGNIEVDSALSGVVITTEFKVNRMGDDDGRSVIVKVVSASWGILTIVTTPREALRVFIMVILSEDMVTFIVALEVGSIVKYTVEALNRKKI